MKRPPAGTVHERDGDDGHKHHDHTHAHRGVVWDGLGETGGDEQACGIVENLRKEKKRKFVINMEFNSLWYCYTVLFFGIVIILKADIFNEKPQLLLSTM